MANAQTKSEIRDVLEQFCVEHYDDCFSPRVYVQESLEVKSIVEKEWGLYIKGVHTYKGVYVPFIGRMFHSRVDFRAEIRPTSEGVNVVFYKWYEPDITHPDGQWEKCENNIITDFQINPSSIHHE